MRLSAFLLVLIATLASAELLGWQQTTAGTQLVSIDPVTAATTPLGMALPKQTLTYMHASALDHEGAVMYALLLQAFSPTAQRVLVVGLNLTDPQYRMCVNWTIPISTRPALWDGLSLSVDSNHDVIVTGRRQQETMYSVWRMVPRTGSNSLIAHIPAPSADDGTRNSLVAVDHSARILYKFLRAPDGSGQLTYYVAAIGLADGDVKLIPGDGGSLETLNWDFRHSRVVGLGRDPRGTHELVITRFSGAEFHHQTVRPTRHATPRGTTFDPERRLLFSFMEGRDEHGLYLAAINADTAAEHVPSHSQTCRPEDCPHGLQHWRHTSL